MSISFNSITTTTGITAGQIYYVVNAATNSFQLAATIGGTPLTLTNDGSGIILPYKIAVIQIYPTSGAAFFQSLLTLNARHSSQSFSYYNGWLDLAISGRFTSLNLGGTSPTVSGLLEQVRILKHRCTGLLDTFNGCLKLQNVIEVTADSGISVTQFNNMFTACRSLKNIPLIDTANATDISNMFNGCTSLQNIPLLNTSNVTSMNSTFQGCNSLQNIPLIDTNKVTNMSNTFQGCTSLQTIPLLNTSNVTTMATMFGGCTALQSIPLFNTINVITMSNTFSTCNLLQTIPLLNTSNVTSMEGLFVSCNNIKSIPVLNTSKVSNFTRTFQGCNSLQNIPLLNTSNVTTMNFTFSGCTALQSIPLIDTINVNSMGSCFFNCNSLVTIPLLNTSNITTLTQAFQGCTALQSIPLLNTSNCTVFSMFTSCNNLQQIPAFDLSKATAGNIGAFASSLPSLSKISAVNIYYSWSVTNCKLSGTALDEVYTNLPTVFAQGTAVTFDGTADTVTLNNHGFANLRTVSFATITTTTGISINTNYFVRNVTTNTFQLSTTATGAIINLVNNGSGTLNGQTITVTGNWGTATDTPSIATAKGWAVTGS
jgi:hypothetical protein